MRCRHVLGHFDAGVQVAEQDIREGRQEPAPPEWRLKKQRYALHQGSHLESAAGKVQEVPQTSRYPRRPLQNQHDGLRHPQHCQETRRIKLKLPGLPPNHELTQKEK